MMNIHEIIKSTVTNVIKEHSFHHHHPEYRMLEGDRMITTVFDDNSRLQFEIHFRENRGTDREKHRKQAASKWRSLASKIYKENQTLNEVGNEVGITWKEAFDKALTDPEMKEFIRSNLHHQIYPR